jgi:tetratricopeptide (TPR) repeat protein
VATLDRLLRQEKSAGVRSVLRRVDADPYRDAMRDAVLANDRKKFVELAQRKTALEQPPGFAAFLGESEAIPVERRRQLLEAAVSRRPEDVDLLMTLASSYTTKQHDWVNERLRWFQAAVAAAPANLAALNDLGSALRDKKDVAGAEAAFRKAIALDPTFANAHNNLGAVLCDVKRDYDGAIACFRTAIELDPKDAKAHANLGVALGGKGQVDEAIACYKKAIELDPKDANAHVSLGIALAGKRRLDEAIACFRKTIELDPKYAKAHYNLGNALYGKGQVDEAIACFRRAIELNPEDANAHANLGYALSGKGKVEEAIACYHKAIALDSKLMAAHFNLGNALYGKGQVDEAIASYKKAIEIEPNYPEAHCNLGGALQQQGRFAESLSAYRRGHELGTKQLGWRFPSAQWVRQAKRLAATESKLPAFLKGEFQPRDTAERFGLAGVCAGKKLHATATRLYAAAFAADPKLADDLRAGHRYSAACYAALAAAGKGKDAARLDDKERTRLRQQALDWLKADLALYAKWTASGPANALSFVQERLKHWQKDSDLAGIRDKAALAKLSAEERATCAKLWADVATLLERVEGQAK